MVHTTPRTTAVRIATLVVALFATVALGAQSASPAPTTLSLADLDLSGASVHQAGPASFYVRGVVVDATAYSFIIEQSDAEAWSVTRIIPESANILPPETVLDFATVSVGEGDTIRIDGVLVGDRVYSGSLAVGEDADLTLAEQIRVGTDEAINEARAEAVREIFVAESREELEAALAEQRAGLERTIETISRQRDTFRDERDALAAANEELAAERDALAEERARLEEQLAQEPAAEAAPGTDAAVNGDGSSSDESAASGGTTSPLSGEQVAQLIKERDQLAGDIVGLVMENNELRDERRSLREQIEQLQSRNGELQEDITTMTSEIDRLQELVAAYRSTVGPDPRETADAAAEEPARSADAGSADAPAREATAPPAEWTFPGDYLRASDLEEAAAAVTGELRALEQRVAALETAAVGLAELEEEIRTGIRRGLPGTRLAAEPAGGLPGSADTADPGVPRVAPESEEPTGPAAEPDPDAEPVRSATDEGRSGATDEPDATEERATEDDARVALVRAEQAERIAALQAEVADLLAANEALRSEKQELEARVVNEILENGFVAIMRERLSRRLVRGFTTAEPDTGAWTVTPEAVLQADEDAYFAKLAMPVRQSGEPVLYSFQATSLDDGWVGMGLHLFVDDVARRRGYGMGSSLLVWLTRDPDERKESTTYLQLYRSDDDVNMARVLDAAIPEDVNETMHVEVLYEPESQYITVAIDGTDRVRYRTWFGVDSGVEIALRSLGRAEFRDFAVSTEPVGR